MLLHAPRARPARPLLLLPMMMMLLILAHLTPLVLSYNNGVSRTPPMGWNRSAKPASCLFATHLLDAHACDDNARALLLRCCSWNHFHGGVSAAVLATTADAFVDLGLKDAGYLFINTVPQNSYDTPAAVD